VSLLDGVYVCVSVGSVYVRVNALPHNVILSHIYGFLFILTGLFSCVQVSFHVYVCVSVGSVCVCVNALSHNVIFSDISGSLFIFTGRFSYLRVSVHIHGSLCTYCRALRVPFHMYGSHSLIYDGVTAHIWISHGARGDES